MKKRVGKGPLCVAILLLPVLALLGVSGCSHAVLPNGGGNNGGGSNKGQVTLAIQDAPTSGIAILSFEVTVTGALLQPGNVSLISTPQTVELTQLAANSAFLSTSSVAAASYTSLAVTLANPSFTFLNQTGTSIPLGNGQTCNTGAICVFTPTSSPAQVTFSSQPFPVTLTSGAGVFLLVDANLNKALNGTSVDFTQSGATSVTSSSFTSTQLTNVADTFSLTGEVASTGSNTFNLTASNGQTFTIATNASTQFQFQGDPACTANNSACLAQGQIVDVNLDVLGNGTFVANEVDFNDAPGTHQVIGLVASLNNSPPTSLQLITHSAVLASGQSLAPGTLVNVSLANNATFVISNGMFSLPVTASFAQPGDLLVGQEIEARVSGSITTGPPVSFTTDRIALRQSQIFATVDTVTPGSNVFVINGLSPLFTQAPIQTVNQIQVDVQATTPPLTIFQNLSPDNMSGLTPGGAQQIAVGGFLFNTITKVGSPTLQATVVRGE